MLRNDEIQAAWVSYLKSNANILAQLDDTDEIREDGWKGAEFTYPNIRVRIIDNTPEAGRDCNLHSVTISTMAFSEQQSSQQADRIAGIIMDELHRGTSLAPAVWSDEQTWRSEAIMSIRASG